MNVRMSEQLPHLLLCLLELTGNYLDVFIYKFLASILFTVTMFYAGIYFTSWCSSVAI